MRVNDATPQPADPALALVTACARPLSDPDRVAAIACAATPPIDSGAVVTLAYRHRIEGFVEQGLAAAGVVLETDAAARLTARATAARLQALRNAGEEVRVGHAFAEAGIDALFVKGATLGMRAHGTLSLKSSWDVDMLVARDRLEDAGRVLSALGYRLSIFGSHVDDPVRVRRFVTAHKEVEWHHAERGVTVELHTGLTDSPAALPSVGLGSLRQPVELMPGQVLETLATGPLFAYLAYHGTAHLWARLKWLADVVALVRGADVAALHAEAVALGAGRTPGVAIALAHDLLGLDVPSALLAAIRADGTTRRLLTASHAAIAAGQGDHGRLMRPLGELLAYMRAQAWLVPGAPHRWHAVRRFATQPYTASHLRVPRWALPIAIVGALPLRLLLRPIRLRRERCQAGGNVASRP